MKTMKKLLALVMALALCLSLGVCAFADGEDTEVEEVTSTTTTDAEAPIVKVVTGDNAPRETYTFTVTAKEMSNTPSSVTTQPTIPDVTITTGTTIGAKSAALDLTAITEIGIYTYTIAESIPTSKTAGIGYDTTTYTLKVTAYLETTESTDAEGDTTTVTTLKKDISITDKNGNKVTAATFINTYTANTLTVTKDVTGNLGDTTKEFSFTVTFANSDEAITWVNAITYNSDTTGAASVDVSGNTVTFTLSDSDSITFSNIPSGITYTVTEASYASDGYTTKIGGTETSTATGTMAGENVSVTVVNDKDQTVDTGITLDSLPYVLVLVAVLALGAVMIIRKRRVED